MPRDVCNIEDARQLARASERESLIGEASELIKIVSKMIGPRTDRFES